ncbi:hypothetical protein BVX97_03900 [bacterium E08(2017)]|nr:hypothetical protein BVX97_03900 [bacterium E08(2017)]
MKRRVRIELETRPEGLGIVWTHNDWANSYPGKLIPGYVVTARICGMPMYLEIVDVPHEKCLKARILELDECCDDTTIISLFEEGTILKLNRDQVFACEPPRGAMTPKEKSATVLLRTQEIRIFEEN